MYNKSKHPIPARASRKGGKKGCLCKDSTYSVKCCDGSLIAQGIGTITGRVIYNIFHNGTQVTYNGANLIHYAK